MEFKSLSRGNQVRVINNVLTQHDARFLAYLITEETDDILGWFNISDSIEGSDYWVDLFNQHRVENE
jgi:hypothetical protein